MRFLFTFLLSILIFGSTWSQYTWTTMDPPNKESLFVFHCSDTHFFAKDILSNIYVSTDELETWTQIASRVSITTRFAFNMIGTVVQEDKSGNFYFFGRNEVYKYIPSDNTFREFPNDPELTNISNIRILDNDNLLLVGRNEIELIDVLGNSIDYRAFDNDVEHVEVGDEFLYVHTSDFGSDSTMEILDYNFSSIENFAFELHDDIREDGFLISGDRLIFDSGVYFNLSSKDWAAFNLSNDLRGNDHLLISGDTIVYTNRNYAISLDGGQTFREGDWDGLVTSATARYYAGLHKGNIFKSNSFCFYGGDKGVFMELSNEDIRLINLEYGDPYAQAVKAGTADNVIFSQCDIREDISIRYDAVSDWIELDDSYFSTGPFFVEPYDIDDWTFLPNGDIIIDYFGNFRSKDNGRTWNIDNNIIDPIFGFLVVKGDNIYVKSENRIYHSLYDGEEWTELYTFDPTLLLTHKDGISIDGYYYNNGYESSLGYIIIRHNLSTGVIDSIPQQTDRILNIITSNYSRDFHFLSETFDGGDNYNYYNRSSDNGETFVQIDITELVGSSQLSTHVSLVLDRADNLILRTRDNIYASLDQGENWIDITPTIPEIIKYNNLTIGLDNQMYIATIGAGIIKADFILAGLERKPLKIVTYNDENGNCIRDNDERNISGMRVSIDDSYISVSNEEGEIFYRIPEGNHYVRPEIDEDLYRSCQSVYDFDVIGDDTTTVNISIEIINYCSKLESSIGTPFLRRCFDNYYKGYVRNVGTEKTENLSIFVELDPFFDFESVDLDIISFEDQILELDAGELKPNESIDFTIQLTVSCDAELGQEHCVVIDVDADNICNQITLRSAPQECQENIGSYDPNDKAIIVNGEKNADRYDFDDKIEYLIRCQNTGSDTAFNITILDTISKKFKVESIKPMVASHDYKWFVDRGVLNVTFNDIQLVDSTTNEALSHAFVKFEIEIEEDLNYGDVLTNQAAIYFDFNEPIFTNTTMTEISTGSSVSHEAYDFDILIYPNPTEGVFTLNLNSQESKLSKVQIFNMNGLLVLEQKINQLDRQYDLNVSHLSSEVYIIQVTGNNGEMWRSKLVKI